MNYILCNPKSKNGEGQKKLDEFLENKEREYKIVSVLDKVDYASILADTTAEDEIVIIGGVAGGATAATQDT